MITFKVNAKVISIFNKKTQQSEYLNFQQTGDDETYDTNQIIILANNGLKNKQGETLYKSSIEITSKGEVKAEGEKLDLTKTNKSAK